MGECWGSVHDVELQDYTQETPEKKTRHSTKKKFSMGVLSSFENDIYQTFYRDRVLALLHVGSL